MKYSVSRKYLVVFVAFIAIFALTLSSCKSKAKEPAVIKIGAILPLSGDAAQYGEWGKSGIDLAVEEINSKGGINNKKIEVIYEDDAADPKKGVSAANKLITIDGVKVIIGPIPSTVTLAVAPICEKNKVIIMSSSSSPAITSAGDYIFRNWPSDDFEGTAMADYAIKKGYKRVAVFNINNEYGLGVVKVFKKKFSELGGKVVISETFAQGSSDMKPQLLKIKDRNPDAIYLVGHAKENGHVVKQARDLKIKAKILGTVGIEGPDFINIAGEAAEGLVYTAPAFDPDSAVPLIKKYQVAYAKKYGKKSEIFAATMYDATKIVALMIEKYGYDPDKIKEGLYSLKNYSGVTGNTTFDSNGDVIKAVMFKTVKNGKFVTLKD